MCQHRLADYVADGVDVRHVGALLFVHFDKAAFGYCHACFFGGAEFAVWRATCGNQYQIVTLRFFGGFFAFKGNIDAIGFGFHGNGFGAGHDVVKAMGVHFFPYFFQIAVCALHQAVHHFYYV